MLRHRGARGHDVWLQPGREDGGAYTPSTMKKRKQAHLNLLLYTYCTRTRDRVNVSIWEPRVRSTPFASASLFDFHTPHTDAHTSNKPSTTTTTAAAMCTGNFKELKRRFRKHVTHTCLLGNVCSLHSDSSVTFSYVIRSSNQVGASPPGNTLDPISCRCHVWLLVAEVAPRREVTKPHYVKTARVRRKGSASFGVGWCDSDMWYGFRGLTSPDRWRGKCEWMRGLWTEITRGDCEMCHLLIRLRAE